MVFKIYHKVEKKDRRHIS